MTPHNTQAVSNCKPYEIIDGRYYDRPQRQSHSHWAKKLNSKLLSVVPPLYVQQKAHLRKLPEILRQRFIRLEDWKGIYMFGSVGCGKTFTACAFARYFALKSRSVMFTTYDDLCLEVRSSFSDLASELAVIKKYRQPDKLFIDDLGTAVSVGCQESNFAVRLLYDVLDWRIKNLKATFFTSNKSPEEIASSFDERIASRLYQACEIVPVKGADKRK